MNAKAKARDEAKPPVTPKVGIAAARYIRIPLFCAITGYTERAVEGKIAEGVWRQGEHFRRPEDGHILMDLEAYYQWVEKTKAAA